MSAMRHDGAVQTQALSNIANEARAKWHFSTSRIWHVVCSFTFTPSAAQNVGADGSVRKETA
jgi:hypothetical protein